MKKEKINLDLNNSADEEVIVTDAPSECRTELVDIEQIPSDVSDPNASEKEEFKELLNKNGGSYESALFEYCYIHNIFYNTDIVKIISSSGIDENTDVPFIYKETLNADFRFQGLTFFEQIKRENFEKIYSEELSLLTLTEDDKKNRQQIIDILGYDPFKDENPADKPQLYRDLTGMLTDAMRKDIAKQKAALNVVRSYSNIEKYQQKVNELMSSGSADEAIQEMINNYLKIISTIQTSINQTAEKNNFTVKGIGSNGRGMLSDVMNQIEERGIDAGITNYYDIATSKSISEIANISWKSMLNQVNLSKTDYADIISDQAELVKRAQSLARDSVEALRLAKEKITKQELIQELERDYRRKGISEEDILEFINREIHMYDLHDES